MADVLFKLFLLILITFPINVWASWDFMSLNPILNQDCNPVTYVQVMRLFLQAALVYEAIFAFPFHGEELMYWLTKEELETVRSGLEKQPFGLHGWLGMDMSFYSNASDNMVVVMDCGDLEVLYGAASEVGYKKLMEVMEGLGEAI